MKKIISLILALCLLFACGCAEETSADAESTAGSSDMSGETSDIPDTLKERKKSNRTVLYAAVVDVSASDDLSLEDMIYFISVSGCGAAVADGHTASAIAELYATLDRVRFELPTIALGESQGAAKEAMEKYPEYFFEGGKLPEGAKTVALSEFLPSGGDVSKLSLLAEKIYEENGWETASPLPPMVLEYHNNSILLTRSGYPLKYAISKNSDMSGAEFLPLTSYGIPYADLLDGGRGEAYLQVEGLFGKSETVKLTLSDSAELFAPGTVGIAYREDFENITVEELERHWRFDPEGVYEDVGQGGFYISGGKFVGQWIYGRAMQLRYPLENYRISCELKISSGSRVTDCQSVLALRQPIGEGFYTQMYETSGSSSKLSMGVHGIYITGFNEGSSSYMEVALHYADASLTLGAGTVSAYFKLPRGVNFQSGVRLDVRDFGERIEISCEGVHYCTVELSELSDKDLNKNAKYDGERYTKAKIVSPEGELLAECESADIPKLGTICFTERGNIFTVDDIEIELYE